MARINKDIVSDTTYKTTRQGSGTYSKKTSPGGEIFSAGQRAGSPPSKAHRRKKPYKGQGK